MSKYGIDDARAAAPAEIGGREMSDTRDDGRLNSISTASLKPAVPPSDAAPLTREKLDELAEAFEEMGYTVHVTGKLLRELLATARAGLADTERLGKLEDATAIFWKDRGGSLPAGMPIRQFLDGVTKRSGQRPSSGSCEHGKPFGGTGCEVCDA